MSGKYDRKIPAILLTDFYKVFHASCFHPETEQMILYFTPRRSRLEGVDYAVCFGLQYAIKHILIDQFQTTFFERPWEEIREAYLFYVGQQFDREIAQRELEGLKRVHEYGFLPIQIRAVPEGTRVPIGCPMAELRATRPGMYWLPEYLETVLSCTIWQASTDAAIADHNRRALVDVWYDKTAEDSVPRCMAGGNFSMRGMPGIESALLADGAHLLSFRSTATVATSYWLDPYYAIQDVREFSQGTPSTEHSVMESYGEDQELEAYRDFLTRVRPNGTISMVSDTWNLWRTLTDYLPQLKEIILNRQGRVLIRPDSGYPADIVCGARDPYIDLDTLEGETKEEKLKGYFEGLTAQRPNQRTHRAQTDWEMVDASMSQQGELRLEIREKTPEEHGVIGLLWNLFGGRVNQKGYRVLHPSVGIIYGDAITFEMGTEIFQRLAEKGFAANNIVLGFGSYTYQYVTRDSLGFALKATLGVVAGEERYLYKDPITDRGRNSAGKKSQIGGCIVKREENGLLSYTDHHTLEEIDAPGNLLRPVFCDGRLLVDESFETIRRRLHPNF